MDTRLIHSVGRSGNQPRKTGILKNLRKNLLELLRSSRNGDSRSSTRAVISSFNASYVSSRTHSGLHLFQRRTAAITFLVLRTSKLHGCFVVANTWVNSAPKKKISEE